MMAAVPLYLSIDVTTNSLASEVPGVGCAAVLSCVFTTVLCRFATYILLSVLYYVQLCLVLGCADGMTFWLHCLFNS